MTRKSAIDPREIPLGDVLQFMALIWAIDHEMERVSKRMEARVGLTIPQRLSLLLLGRRPGMRASDLAEALHLHRGTVTGILHRLEAAGYVRRTADPDDGRRTGLSLTAAGRRVNARRAGTFEGAVRRVLAAATARDLLAATRLLSMLSSELRAVAEAPEPGTLTSGIDRRYPVRHGTADSARASRPIPPRDRSR